MKMQVENMIDKFTVPIRANDRNFRCNENIV